MTAKLRRTIIDDSVLVAGHVVKRDGVLLGVGPTALRGRNHDLLVLRV